MPDCLSCLRSTETCLALSFQVGRPTVLFHFLSNVQETPTCCPMPHVTSRPDFSFRSCSQQLFPRIFCNFLLWTVGFDPRQMSAAHHHPPQQPLSHAVSLAAFSHSPNSFHSGLPSLHDNYIIMSPNPDFLFKFLTGKQCFKSLKLQKR